MAQTRCISIDVLLRLLRARAAYYLKDIEEEKDDIVREHYIGHSCEADELYELIEQHKSIPV